MTCAIPFSRIKITLQIGIVVISEGIVIIGCPDITVSILIINTRVMIWIISMSRIPGCLTSIIYQIKALIVGS
jgi:hypothetical protein